MLDANEPYFGIPDDQCLASANVVPGQLKRCALPAGHEDPHTWTEALRADGRWLIAMWGADKKVTTVEYESKP